MKEDARRARGLKNARHFNTKLQFDRFVAVRVVSALSRGSSGASSGSGSSRSKRVRLGKDEARLHFQGTRFSERMQQES